MLALSACEPIPVEIIASEPPLTEESDKYEEGSFAETLAALLRKGDPDSAADTDPARFSDVKVDVDNSLAEEPETGNIFEFIKKAGEIADVREEDHADKKIHDENLSAFFNIQNVLMEQPVENIDAPDFLSGISNLISENFLPELELEADFFMVEPKGTANVAQAFSGQAAAAVEGLEKKKEPPVKDRDSIKSENVQALFNKDDQNDKIAGLKTKPDNANGSRLDELRGKSRKGLAIEVRDSRTDIGKTNNASGYSTVEAAASRRNGEAPVREITLELRLPDQLNAPRSAQTTWAARAESAMENMLARELHQNFNGDIVRHASMALRDGGEGTIKIALKPENLGNVKIHLEMTENKITGRIVVESAEALNAFRKELSSLEQAFRDSGFHDADLNLSLTSGGQNANDWEYEKNSFTPRMAALRYDGEQGVFGTVNVFYGQKSGSIDMLA